MRTKLFPSVACADFACLGEQIRLAVQSGVDGFHLDIMDGRFVPMLTFGPDVVRAIREESGLVMDYHFMCAPLEPFLGMFPILPGDRFYLHPESTYHPYGLLADMRARGCHTGVVLSPGVSPAVIKDLLPVIDGVMLMAVNTGMAGSAFIPGALDKLQRVKVLAAAAGKELEYAIDGSVGQDNVARIVKAGFGSLVLGYPGCFNRSLGVSKTLTMMKERIREAEANT